MAQKGKKDFISKEVFTTYDAARICNANIASIKNWIGKGLLRAFRTPGGHYRIKRRDLELFVQKYNMPYPFDDKVRKKVYLLDTDRKAAKDVKEAAGTNEVSVFGDTLHAALHVGLERPDVLVFDVKSKAFDGMAFLKLLQSYPDTRNIQLVIYSKGLKKAQEMDFRKNYHIEDIVAKDDVAGLAEAFSHITG